MEHIIAFFNRVIENQYTFILLISIVSFLSYVITRYILSNIISRFFKKTSTEIDDILIDKGFLARLAYIVPLVVIHSMVIFRFGEIDLFSKFIYVFFTIITLSAINSILSAVNEIHSRSKYSDKLNIKSYIQILKLIVSLFGIIIIISFLSGKNFPDLAILNIKDFLWSFPDFPGAEGT